MTETHLKPVELKACPWCQKPMTITDGYNPIGRCDTENCWMHERKMTVTIDSPFMVEQWNTRTVDTELLEALKDATAALEDGTGLDDAICCSGHDCGCRGSTNRDWLMHNLRAAITKAEAGS